MLLVFLIAGGPDSLPICRTQDQSRYEVCRY